MKTIIKHIMVFGGLTVIWSIAYSVFSEHRPATAQAVSAPIIDVPFVADEVWSANFKYKVGETSTSLIFFRIKIAPLFSKTDCTEKIIEHSAEIRIDGGYDLTTKCVLETKYDKLD